jgi:hypothetical protein
MTPKAARFLLNLTLDPENLARIHDLAVKRQDGDLTAQEEAELRSYRRVGLQLDLLRARSQAALHRESPNGPSVS